MKFFHHLLCPTMSLLAVALWCGGAGSARANTETFNLTFANAVTAPASIVATDGKVVSVTTENGFSIRPGGEVLSFPSFSSTPGLFGSVHDLEFKPTKSGASARVKAIVSLLNGSDTALHNVTATVYLSSDDTLSADDTTLLTLKLSDYVSHGKIGKHKALSLPLNQKVPSKLASFLNGKYLIVVLSADDLGTLPSTPVVVGPIMLP